MRASPGAAVLCVLLAACTGRDRDRGSGSLVDAGPGPADSGAALDGGGLDSGAADGGVDASAPVDAGCDGELVQRLPIELRNTATEPLDDGAVRIVIDDAGLIAALGDGASLRAYDETPADPWASPYGGLPLWMETLPDDTLALWVRTSIPASGSTTVHLYWGAGGAASVADPDATFELYSGFNTEGSAGEWSFSSNYTAFSMKGRQLTDGAFVSAPTSLTTYISPAYPEDLPCPTDLYAFAGRTLTLEAGTYRVGVFGRATCTVCNHHVLMDGVLLDRSETGSFTYREAVTEVTAGDHTLQIGMYADAICNGTFRAWSDDVRVTRTVDPAPTPTLDPGSAITECYR